jgi:hypothetical protein
MHCWQLFSPHTLPAPHNQCWTLLVPRAQVWAINTSIIRGFDIATDTLPPDPCQQYGRSIPRTTVPGGPLHAGPEHIHQGMPHARCVAVYSYDCEPTLVMHVPASTQPGNQLAVFPKGAGRLQRSAAPPHHSHAFTCSMECSQPRMRLQLLHKEM